MSIRNKFRTVFRGDISFASLVREALRRRRQIVKRRVERRDLDLIGGLPPRLSKEVAQLDPDQLSQHFRAKVGPTFWPDPSEGWAELLDIHFPQETRELIEVAENIVRRSTWDLAGLGPLTFSGENYWRRDPLGDHDWGLAYHADVVVYEEGGPDIRVLWELNRLGHTIPLACAFAATGDRSYAETFFSHVESWMEQNPYGRGANWNCAMEVALRAINLLAAFDLFRRSDVCTGERVESMLRLFDQHGRFIRNNDEFSYLITSNHYLSDVVGLFWLGTLLPELEQARDWSEFGRSEMLCEIDKQILPDGADFEASTGYHSFVAQMLLYSFLLAGRNGIQITAKYKDVLARMLGYTYRLRRPEGGVPLIGDADGSQIVPVVKRDSSDQDYLLAVGSVYLNEPALKLPSGTTPELAWLLGQDGVSAFAQLASPAGSPGSVGFADAGSYVMRSGDLYLHLNTSDCGANGRGSHGHNDALSVEVSAFGRPFIIDPGSYVYNLDRPQRHLFRSTEYHSTVAIDRAEQGVSTVDMPFIMGNQARPSVLEWKTGPEQDVVLAEHSGYLRLARPVRHRRRVEFNRNEGYWIIEDKLEGEGRHFAAFSFHLAPGVTTEAIDLNTVRLGVDRSGSLYIGTLGLDASPEVRAAFASRNYGHREASTILKWEMEIELPFTARFILLPAGPHENADQGLELLRRLTDNIDN